MRALLFFFAVIAVFIFVMVAISRLKNLGDALKPKQDADKEKSQSENQEKPMVKCAHCGVYLPETEALPEEENEAKRFFCSSQHQQAFHKLEEK